MLAHVESTARMARLVLPCAHGQADAAEAAARGLRLAEAWGSPGLHLGIIWLHLEMVRSLLWAKPPKPPVRLAEPPWAAYAYVYVCLCVSSSQVLGAKG